LSYTGSEHIYYYTMSVFICQLLF